MKSFSVFYGQKLSYPEVFKKYPIIELGWTNETDEPYRAGHCVVVKPPFTNTALALGVWGKKQEEEQALTKAVGGRSLEIDPSDIMDW